MAVTSTMLPLGTTAPKFDLPDTATGDMVSVDDFADAIRAQESRHQDIGAGCVHLLLYGGVHRSDLEMPTFFSIQNRSEHAG